MLEESAQMSGANFFNVIRKVTLRLAWPGILASGIYIVTIGFASFDVPAIIGMSNRIFTFSTYLLTQLAPHDDLPHYGKAAALSTVVMAVSGLLAIWYGKLQSQAHRYQVVTGKGYRPRIIQLRKYKWAAWTFLGLYFVLSKFLPLIIVICAIGAYTVHNAMLDIWFMLGFGVIGYIFKKLDYPMGPMVLALVLGDRAEDSFRQAMLISQGNLSVFFSNWLVGGIMTLGLVMLFWPLVAALKAKLRAAR